jgi:hypothetical protein
VLVAEAVRVAVDVDQRVLHELGGIEGAPRAPGAREQDRDPGAELGLRELVQGREGGLVALVPEERHQSGLQARPAEIARLAGQELQRHPPVAQAREDGGVVRERTDTRRKGDLDHGPRRSARHVPG